MKTTIFVMVCVFGGVVSALLSNIGVFDIFAPVAEIEKEPNYSLPTYLSFVSVMMTAVTAVLAALAVAIGIIAWFTFREIKVIAADIATKEAKKVANSDNIEKLLFESILGTGNKKETDDKNNTPS